LDPNIEKKPLIFLVSIFKFMGHWFDSYTSRDKNVLVGWENDRGVDVASQMTLSIADRPYKSTRVFSVCFVLTRTLIGKLHSRSPIQRLLQVKHSKLWSSYGMGYQKEDASC